MKAKIFGPSRAPGFSGTIGGKVPGAFMKIVNEASRLFFAMLALILVAMLTTPSSLTNTADAVLAKNKSAKSESKSSPTKKDKLVKNKKYNKTLADLF